MTIQKTIALCLCLAVLCVAAVSCGHDGDMEAFEPYLPETVEPLGAEMQKDYTQDPETLAYLEEMKQSFDRFPASPAGDFKVADATGGVCVTDYLGTDIAVRIPDQIDGKAVVGISDAAFADQKALERLYIPDRVKTYGTGILKGCSSLKALHAPLPTEEEKAFLGYLFGAKAYTDNARDVPSALVYFELGGSTSTLAPYAFFDCNDLALVTLPSEVQEIGKYAFFNCISLLAIDLSEVTSIGEHALDTCLSLTRLDLGEQLTQMGFAALQGCDGLRRLTLPFVGDGGENGYLGYVFGAEVPDFAKGFYPPMLCEVEVLPTCEALENYAFYECISLTRVTLPEGLASIGVRAFAGCIRLETVGVAVLDGCVRLETADLPASLERIRENAFFGCLSLKSIAFAPASQLQTIGVNAFYQCQALDGVTLPASLKALPASCFADCFSLKTIDLGGVMTVGKNAFHRCTALQSVNASDGLVWEDGNAPLDRVIAPKE